MSKGTDFIYDTVAGMEPATDDDMAKLRGLARAARKEYEWQRKEGWPTWEQLPATAKRERVRAELLFTPKDQAPEFK